MRSVILVVGVGSRFGTGHQVRMSELRDRLERIRITTTWIEVTAFDDAAASEAARAIARIDQSHPQNTKANPVHSKGPAPLMLIDARDLNPTAFAKIAYSILVLDNRHNTRSSPPPETGTTTAAIEFYDTIPHPLAELPLTLDQALLRADVCALKSEQNSLKKDSKSLFVYSGEFLVPELDRVLLDLAASGWSVSRCGSQKPLPESARTIGEGSPSPFRWSPRLKRDAFLQALAEADWVWTYFGMTLLEAWYLGRPPALLPVESPVHVELATYLQKAAGLSSIDPAANANAVDLWNERAEARMPAAENGPGDQGFHRLVTRIRALCVTD